MYDMWESQNSPPGGPHGLLSSNSSPQGETTRHDSETVGKVPYNKQYCADFNDVRDIVPGSLFTGTFYMCVKADVIWDSLKAATLYRLLYKERFMIWAINMLSLPQMPTRR